MVNAFPVQRAHTPGHRAQTSLLTGVADKPALERGPKILRPWNRPSRQPTSIERPPNRLYASPVDLYRGHSPPSKLLGDDQLAKGSRRPCEIHAAGKAAKCATMMIAPKQRHVAVWQLDATQWASSLEPGGISAHGGIMPAARRQNALLVAAQNQPAATCIDEFYEARWNVSPDPVS